MQLEHRLPALLQLHLHSWHNTLLVSVDWAKTMARRREKHLSFGIWYDLYWRFYGRYFLKNQHNRQPIAHPWGWDGVSFLSKHSDLSTSWIIAVSWLQYSTEYHNIVGCIIKILECIGVSVYSTYYTHIEQHTCSPVTCQKMKSSFTNSQLNPILLHTNPFTPQNSLMIC